MKIIRVIPTVLKHIKRSPIRTTLTLSGVSISMFLFVMVESMQNGVKEATEITANESTLVVYRENRYCPFSSRLPQYYEQKINDIDEVKHVVPIQIHVSNCGASLDVVTFRGIPRDSIKDAIAQDSQIIGGTIDDWKYRGDAAIIGSSLAKRRGLSIGDKFSSAGIDVYVAAIQKTDLPQDKNIAIVQLPFLQENARKGGTGSTVTQFNVKVTDSNQLDKVASKIDEIFANDEHPTSTFPEKAFVGRAARDIVELAEVARFLSWGALAAVFALVSNAVVLAVRDRIKDHAVFQTIGFTGWLIAWMVMIEGMLIALSGGLLGGLIAYGTIQIGNFTMTMEGVNIEISTKPNALILGLCISISLGIFAAAIPALKLTRTNLANCFRAV